MKRYSNTMIIGTLCALLGLNSCGLAQWAVLNDPNADNTTKGTVMGATSGASLGSWIGSITGSHWDNGDRALAGGAIGAVVGGLAGAAIGNSMDKPKKQAQQQQQYQQQYYDAPSNGDELYDQGYAGPQHYYPESRDNSLYFSEQSYKLSRNAQRSLDQVAQRLKTDPNAVAEIYGHSDDRGNRVQLKRISTQRAQVVRDYLMARGVPGSKIYVKGCADQYPVASNATGAGRARNRRVEVYVKQGQARVQPQPRRGVNERRAQAASLRQPQQGAGFRYEPVDEMPTAAPAAAPTSDGETRSTVNMGSPSATHSEE